MALTSPPSLLVQSAETSVPIEALSNGDWAARKTKLSAGFQAQAEAQRFEAKEGQVLLLTSANGPSRVLAGMNGGDALAAAAAISQKLPAGTYRFIKGITPSQHYSAGLGWLLAHYAFTRYRSTAASVPKRTLMIPSDDARIRAEADAAATWIVRDMVNTPAEDMKPSDIEAAARSIADQFGAKISAIIGDDLLAQNFPTIHAVGRAATDAPRLVDMTWGEKAAPKVTLVGKGVSFDSGGLNIKPGNSMRLMKKDMGGAAHVLGLAHRIMAAKLPVRLRVLIPTVENAIAGNAFRPGDIITSRKGISIEIGNTDAEGRLILCDALALADDESPDYLIDFATLTGAARVALGPDLAPFYTTDDDFASKTAKAGERLADPIWRMPLYQPYMPMLDSPIADTNNITDGGFAGSITAALFLQKFVERAKSWTHLDVFAWCPKARPGHPAGGDAFAIRAIFDVLSEQFAKK